MVVLGFIEVLLTHENSIYLKSTAFCPAQEGEGSWGAIGRVAPSPASSRCSRTCELKMKGRQDKYFPKRSHRAWLWKKDTGSTAACKEHHVAPNGCPHPQLGCLQAPHGPNATCNILEGNLKHWSKWSKLTFYSTLITFLYTFNCRAMKTALFFKKKCTTSCSDIWVHYEIITIKQINITTYSYHFLFSFFSFMWWKPLRSTLWAHFKYTVFLPLLHVWFHP